MIPCKRFVGAFLICLNWGLLLSSPVYAEKAVEVFKIFYSDAESLQDAIRTVLSPAGKMSVDSSSNALVIVDHPEVIKRVRDLLARLDRKPKNIRIHVEFIEKGRLKDLRTRIRWRTGGTGWSVGTVPFLPLNSLEAGLSAGNSTVNGRKKQFLLLMENRHGRIFVGEEVPFTNYYLRYGHRHGHITQNVSFKKVGTSFSVTAHTAGEGKIKITLDPEVSYYDREKKSFRVKKASTTIIVDDPGTVVLASSNDQSDSFTMNFLRGIDRSNSRSSFSMILSVRSED